LFIEDDTGLKKFNLPSTACVAVSQRFQASADDTLTFDYVILLQSGAGSVAGRPAVRAVLVNLTSESVVSLIDRSLDGSTNAGLLRVASRFRESQSVIFPVSGQYELRFITLVNHEDHGSEAHLLVDSVRVVSSSGQEMSRLASLSCVGRVRQPSLVPSDA
jgi:hypothetical protein